MNTRESKRLAIARERIEGVLGVVLGERNGWSVDSEGWRRWELAYRELGEALATLDALAPEERPEVRELRAAEGSP